MNPSINPSINIMYNCVKIAIKVKVWSACVPWKCYKIDVSNNL